MSKFCVDCRHLNRTDFKCMSPQNFTVSLVTGQPKATEFEYAAAHRANDIPNTCGKSARWFEPAKQLEAAQ